MTGVSYGVRVRPVPPVRLHPWVLRTLVLTVVYGIAEALFVALRSSAPDLSSLWSIVLLLVVVAVVIGWVGAEIVLDRRPPEWTWFITALATAPAAGLLSWILLASFVDDTGVADLQAALVGRASFTALLILAAVFIGSRLGWLSMRRHGEGADDPMLDADDDEVARRAGLERHGPSGAPAPPPPPRAMIARRPRPARRPASASRPPPRGAGPSVPGVRTPGRRSPERVPAAAGPELAERDRMPEAPRLAGERRVSTVRTTARPAEPVSSPFGAEASTPARERPTSDAPSCSSRRRRVLPAFPMPGGPLDDTGSQAAVPDQEPAPEQPSRRKFGLRRPKPGAARPARLRRAQLARAA